MMFEDSKWPLSLRSKNLITPIHQMDPRHRKCSLFFGVACHDHRRCTELRLRQQLQNFRKVGNTEAEPNCKPKCDFGSQLSPQDVWLARHLSDSQQFYFSQCQKFPRHLAMLCGVVSNGLQWSPNTSNRRGRAAMST